MKNEKLCRVLRWGIIGLGRFGQIHARALRAMEGIDLLAASARNPQRLAAACGDLGIPRAYADYRQLLADPNVDAVSITTHWQEHVEVALAALAAGKHVLLEKPMAPTVAECRQLLRAAAASPGLFSVGHVCRFDPRISLARQAVVEGRIGRVVSLHARRNLRRAPGALRLDKISPLMGDGIHDADLMVWLVGRKGPTAGRCGWARIAIPTLVGRLWSGIRPTRNHRPSERLKPCGACRRIRRFRSMPGWR
jgi:UDP-N-acetylglucosamine 3-dehydrogenase